MKRTSQFVWHVALLAAVGVFAQSAFADGRGPARQLKKRNTGSACSAGRSCTGDTCNGNCGRSRFGRAVDRCIWKVQSAAHSGQPFIDPGARADWIAAQRAAVSSWHAGYYHTAWGQPVALMVSPTVRMHTRWSWGVAQSTMHPLYHQYERPYPGPVAGDGTGATTLPLLPTPRWPSHTDQFGVYYVRGPW